MANSDDNSGDEYQSKRQNGSNSSRSQKSKSILKNSYRKVSV
jgi:hypothetical protein